MPPGPTECKTIESIAVKASLDFALLVNQETPNSS